MATNSPHPVDTAQFLFAAQTVGDFVAPYLSCLNAIMYFIEFARCTRALPQLHACDARRRGPSYHVYNLIARYLLWNVPTGRVRHATLGVVGLISVAITTKSRNPANTIFIRDN